MRTGVTAFQPERLIQARESLGITRVALATLVGVSASTITNWEKGVQLPEENKLSSLSNELKFSRSWFLKPIEDSSFSPFYYRSLASTKKKARIIARKKLEFTYDIFQYFDNWLDWPAVKIPSLKFDNHLCITRSEIENAALYCREKMGLGLSPIPDVVLAAENSGVIFCRDEIGELKMDGVSNWNESIDRPFLFVSSDKANGIRNRFDVAHELGHLVLHRYISESLFRECHKEIERQADYFAGCFLMPSESFAKEIKWPTLDTLLALKPKWKTSIASMIMRCYQLSLIDDDQKLRLYKSYSARGWRTKEPYDDIQPLESGRLLNRAFSVVLKNNLTTRADIKDSLGMPVRLIENLSGLIEGYLQEDDNHQVQNLVQLKSSFKESSHYSKKAHIIPFSKR